MSDYDVTIDATVAAIGIDCLTSDVEFHTADSVRVRRHWSRRIVGAVLGILACV